MLFTYDPHPQIHNIKIDCVQKRENTIDLTEKKTLKFNMIISIERTFP